MFLNLIVEKRLRSNSYKVLCKSTNATDFKKEKAENANANIFASLQERNPKHKWLTPVIQTWKESLMSIVCIKKKKERKKVTGVFIKSEKLPLSLQDSFGEMRGDHAPNQLLVIRGEKHQPETSNNNQANSELFPLLSREYFNVLTGYYGWPSKTVIKKKKKQIFFDQWSLWKSDEFLAFSLEEKNAHKVQILQNNSSDFVDQCPTHESTS